MNRAALANMLSGYVEAGMDVRLSRSEAADIVRELEQVRPDLGEPAFVLVARDALAVETIEYWARRAFESGVNPRKLERAAQATAAMELWQADHATKLPD